MIVNAVVRVEVPEGTSPDKAARVIQGVLTLAQVAGEGVHVAQKLPFGYKVGTAFALPESLDLASCEPPEA